MAFSGLKNLFGVKSPKHKKQPAFDEFEVPEDFKFLKLTNLQHLGIPANSTSTLAFDKIQGMLGLGTMDGNLKIFGKEGLEIMIIGQDSNPIELLEFISNKGLLLSYSCLSSTLTLWSLQTLSSDSIPITFQVSRIVYDHGSYSYIGTQHGSLRVFNIEERRLTCFELKPETLEIPPSPLVDICQNPVFSSKLALAYESGDLVIWDLPDHKVLNKLRSDCQIHVCAWAPDGNLIAVGRRDGTVLVYKVGKNAGVWKNFRPDLNASDLNVSAVKAVFWTEDGIVVFGGMPFNSNQQISLVSGKELNDLVVVQVPGKFNPMQMVFSPVAENNKGFLVMFEDEILVFTLPECRMEYIPELFGSKDILCSQYYSICDGLPTLQDSIALLLASGKALQRDQISNIDIYGLLITGHCEGIVRFWGVSSQKIFNILNLGLQNENSTDFKLNTLFYDVSDSAPCKIFHILLDKNKFFTSFDMGKIAIWQVGENMPLINVFKYHKVPIISIKVSDSFIITGDMEGSILFFNTDNSDVTFVENDAKNKQVLSITHVTVILKIVYICYSNGTMKIFNPFSGQFLKAPRLDRVDLKTEVPKRSDWGIVKILYTALRNDEIVICYEKSVSSLAIGNFEENAVQSWNSPMISCNLGHIRSEVYIYVLHMDFTISLLEYGSLKRVWKSEIPAFLHSDYREFHMSIDGHFIITTSHKSLIAGWITMYDEDTPSTEPLWKPNPEVKKADKKSKSFMGIKYSSEINYNSLCNLYSVEKPSSKFRIEEISQSDEEEEEEAKNSVNVVESQVSSAHGAVQEALNKVNERGNKIKSLEEKMREMTEKSKNFAQMAAEIAKKEKNKKWWQL